MCPAPGRARRKSDPPAAPSLFPAVDEHLRPLLDRMPALAWCIDARGRLCAEHGALLRECGTADAFAALDAEALHARALGGETVFFETELEGRVLRGYVEPLHDGAAICGAAGVALDVTAEVRATSALRRSEETLAMAQAAAHLGTWEHDLAGGAVAWSQELFDLCGVRADAYSPGPESLLRFAHAEDREALRTALEAARAEGSAFSLDARVVGADGIE